VRRAIAAGTKITLDMLEPSSATRAE
jgi:hypothetical protein